MSVVRDIMGTYRSPARVMRKLVSMGQREDRALALLMFGCVVIFIAQWPRLARQAHYTGEELNILLGGALLGWVFIMPLVFYTLAMGVYFGFRLFGSKGQSWGQRLALFWAVLAAAPILLLDGLVAGFLGQGAPRMAVGAVWLAAFFWFWFSGSLTAAKETAQDA